MIIVICGPTGSGKTDAAARLSEYYSAPIINGDAFQIYRDMDIGTAKINKDSELFKKHYLIDICSPEETYSVKNYQDDFRKTLTELSGQYKNIIVCGGTGLYIKAALYDYVFNLESGDSDNQFVELSDEELHKMLEKLDYQASLAIHPHNRKRVLRAINIALKNKENKTSLEAKQQHKLIYEDVRFLMISPPREKLYENINLRVDEMFKKGLVDEVKELLNTYKLSLTARQAIGYKEVIDYLENKISLDECKELIKKRSRNYAKRQVTFFKHQLPVKMYDSKEDLIKGETL